MSDGGHSPRFRPTRILAGDIGGTNSRLAIYSHDGGRLELVHQTSTASSEYECLTDVLDRFLSNHQEQIDAACLGLPAPIHSGDVFPLTNLPWEIDREQVRRIVGTDQVALINDVEASAVGINALPDVDMLCLQSGRGNSSGNRVVISVGTGLGVSALTPTGRTFATESGHATFSPRHEIDFKLQARLQLEHGHVSWERVASGTGLRCVYSLLAGDPSPSLEPSEIVGRADFDPVCRNSVDTLRRYIGCAAGNIALTLMASGGVYLVGGVATNVIDERTAGLVLDAFCDKGRMRGLLEETPVFLVRESDIALRGAAETAAALFGTNRSGSLDENPALPY